MHRSLEMVASMGGQCEYKGLRATRGAEAEGGEAEGDRGRSADPVSRDCTT